MCSEMASAHLHQVPLFQLVQHLSPLRRCTLGWVQVLFIHLQAVETTRHANDRMPGCKLYAVKSVSNTAGTGNWYSKCNTGQMSLAQYDSMGFVSHPPGACPKLQLGSSQHPAAAGAAQPGMAQHGCQAAGNPAPARQCQIVISGHRLHGHMNAAANK